MGVTVVNKYQSAFDVYIGRGSRWGNPYRIGPDGDRAAVIAKYKQLLWRQIKEGIVTTDDLRQLDGKRLGCFCKPAACHGDVIAAAVDWALAKD
jgi:hypothetical protein